MKNVFGQLTSISMFLVFNYFARSGAFLNLFQRFALRKPGFVRRGRRVFVKFVQHFPF